ncbi:MAG: cellulase family glycosylhydrolase [Candidatus Omnitrophica bacterium]|nr:cellulase family glycosylhydrolase [Candidatus Omnitrophota bacterium]
MFLFLSLICSSAYAGDASQPLIGEVKVCPSPFLLANGNRFREGLFPRYEKMEIEAEVKGEFKNPYDYEEIEVKAIIKSPDNNIANVLAFPSGQGAKWTVRYTPLLTGKYVFHVEVKTLGSLKSSGPGSFEVKPGYGNGFLRKSPHNDRYLVFDSDRTFFGLGHNIAWVKDNDPGKFEDYFKKFKDNGCNISRVWINSPWTIKIETEKLYRYNLDDSNKMDAVLELARKYGVYLIVSLDSYGTLMNEPGQWKEGSWDKSPYSKKMGGPCAVPPGFFLNKEALKAYRNRLEYIIARWGYSPNILAFEIFNEVNCPPEWLRDTTRYIRSIDPFGHLITTSMKNSCESTDASVEIWNSTSVDLIERHVYANEINENITGDIISVNNEYALKYKKPFLVGEFGMNSGMDDSRNDPDGKAIELHNSIWAASLSGSFASALNWWWDGYVMGKDLYPHYKALRKFLEGTKWDAKNAGPVEISPVMIETGKKKQTGYDDITIYPVKEWGSMKYKEFTIRNNGDISGGSLNYYLQGVSNSEIKINHILKLNFPKEGKLILNVDMVSRGGKLTAYLDGVKAASVTFPVGPGSGPWKKSVYLKEYDVYQCEYDKNIEIIVPKGEHRLRLMNSGEDWIGIKSIKLTDYLSGSYANARITGISVGDERLYWIQNRDSNWREKGQLNEIKNAYFDIKGGFNGQYTVEWWDTYKGIVTSSDTAWAVKSSLRVNIPSFTRDIACKIRRS